MALATLLATGLGGCATDGGDAADIGDANIRAVQLFYQPSLMTSVQEAENAFSALHSSYCDWRGGLAEGVYATPASVLIHTNIHTTYDGSQWVPNWGGSFVGGTYVPYMGGSVQSTHSEDDSPADVAVVPGEIAQITLWQYPNLTRDFKFGLDLNIHHGGQDAVVSFRTTNPEVARQIANAFATLAAANFSKEQRYPPSLGLQIVQKNVAENFARLNWTQSQGVLVDNALADSPAAVAGIRHDDIIATVDGKPVVNADDVRKAATQFLGDRTEGAIELQVFRAGQTLSVPVALKNPNVGIERLLTGAAPVNASVSPVRLGLTVRNLEEKEAKQENLEGGVYINAVDAGSLGQQIGLQIGDILVAINGTPIANLEAMKKALASGSVDTIALLRKGVRITLNGVSKM